MKQLEQRYCRAKATSCCPNFMNTIITGDKSWLYGYHPETESFRHFPYNENPTKALNIDKHSKAACLHVMLLTEEKKIHACVWSFKVASCKRASLKSTRFSQKKKVGYYSNWEVWWCVTQPLLLLVIAGWSASGKLLVVGWPASGSLLLLSDWSASNCVTFGSSSVAWFKVYDLVLHTLKAGYKDFFTLRLSLFLLKQFLGLMNFYRFLMQAGKSCSPDWLGHVQPQKIFHVEEDGSVFYAPLS